MGTLGSAFPSPLTRGSGGRRRVVMTTASAACGERFLNHSTVLAFLLTLEVVSDALTAPSVSSVLRVRVKHVCEALELWEFAKLIFKEHQQQIVSGCVIFTHTTKDILPSMPKLGKAGIRSVTWFNFAKIKNAEKRSRFLIRFIVLVDEPKDLSTSDDLAFPSKCLRL